MNINQSTVARRILNTVFRGMVWGVASWTCQALAEEMPNPGGHRFEHWERASDSELDQLRGGIRLPNGLNIDFSVERIASVNGVVVSSSFFQLPDSVSLIQNGNLNQAPDMAMSGLGVVIQNSLDNQTIKSLTDINLTVSNVRNLELNNNSGAVFNNLILPAMQ